MVQSLLKQGRTEQVAQYQTMPSLLFKIFTEEILQPFWATVLYHPPWRSKGTFCVPVCVHCLFFWHWASLERVWFLPLGIYTYWCNSPWTFSMLSSPSSEPSLTRKVLQSLHHLCGPLLDFPVSCLFCNGGPRTGHSTQSEVSPVMRRGEGSPPLICWQHSS